MADDMTIDHLCRVRNCVRPDHLEVVTAAENTRRRFRAVGGLRPGSECRRGHLVTESTIYRRANGSTECGQCISDRNVGRRRKSSAA